jgi:hypothetical protein
MRKISLYWNVKSEIFSMFVSTPRKHVSGEAWLHSFLTWALDGSEWLINAPASLPPAKEPGYPLNRRMSALHCQY